SSRRRHTRLQGDWSSDVCSSDLLVWRTFAALHELRRTGRLTLDRVAPPVVGLILVLGIVGLLGFGIAAVQLVPTAELTGEGIREIGRASCRERVGAGEGAVGAET